MKRTKWYWISLAVTAVPMAVIVVLLGEYVDWWIGIPRPLRWLASFVAGWQCATFAGKVDKLAAREVGVHR